MRVLIFLMAVIVLSAGSAWAQDNMIRIVQPDGSVVEVEIPTAAPPQEDLPSQPAPVAEELPAAMPASEAVAEPEAAPAAPEPPPVKAEKKKDTLPPKPKKKSPPTDEQSQGYMPEPPPAPVIAPGAEITRELAIEIAIRNAPPISSVKAFPRSFDGRPVFVVVIKTDSGEYDVLVDRQTGEIIKP